MSAPQIRRREAIDLAGFDTSQPSERPIVALDTVRHDLIADPADLKDRAHRWVIVLRVEEGWHLVRLVTDVGTFRLGRRGHIVVREQA
ncbi:hypothetical protein [Polymorphospora lycopeni]|uniref:Uncharacterized protein n=1 Tax=Polymorphospora lycopeni TaxID=3140240 RepID=A0ABV5CNS1_9ACTN